MAVVSSALDSRLQVIISCCAVMPIFASARLVLVLLREGEIVALVKKSGKVPLVRSLQQIHPT